MKTCYKVLTPELRSVASYMPSFPKEFVLQYEQGKWTCGIENSKIFCFDSLTEAEAWIAALKIKRWYGEQSFDIWECQAVNMRPRTLFVRLQASVAHCFVESFRRLWNGEAKQSNKISKATRKIFGAEKLCPVRRIKTL